MKRQPINAVALRRLLLAAPLALLTLVALAVTLWLDNSLNRGKVFAPTPGDPIPFAAVPPGAVNTFNLHLEPDPAVVSRTLELADDLGARYVRMQMPWEDVEIAAKGDFVDRRNDLDGDGQVDAIDAWAKYDRIVDKADALGLELILRIDRPPLWARQQAAATIEFQQGLAEDGNSTGPPDDFADYGNFVAAVAARYQGKVRFIQLWNEPNLKVEWNWQQPSPSEFVALLRAGYVAAKQANPAAVILFPSLAPTDGLEKSAPMSDLDFLDGVYAAGGAAYFDIMSAQLYGLGQPPDEHRYVYWRGDWRRPLDTRTDVSRIVLLREVMELHGDSKKAVWIGEFGWNSAPERIPDSIRNADGSPPTQEQQERFAASRATWGEPVSEQQKGEYIVALMKRARHEWPWVGAMSVWMLRYGGATPPNPADPTPYFALIDRDFKPTPAYPILREYLQSPAVAGVGTHSWQHPAVEPIAGGWRLRFEGQHLELYGGLEGGMDRVEVDGQPALLERAATADGRALWRVVPDGRLAGGAYPWPAGQHVFEVAAPGAEPPFAFGVGQPPALPLWLWVVLPTALLLLLAVLAAISIQALYTVLSA